MFKTMIDSINQLFSHFGALDVIRFGLLGLTKKITSRDAVITYSQTGEERIIMCLLGDKVRNGFYVEVGSNHPTHFSNTFALYCKGWRGITIDANAELVDKHKQLRLRDIPICAAISNIEEDVIFVEYETHELSTIDKKTVDVLEKTSNKVKCEKKIRTSTLTHILEKHLPNNISIDVLSIDVEGHDFSVLASIDLNIYRPKLIVVEIHNFSFDNYCSNEIYQHLIAHNYVLSSYAVWNGYFVDKNYQKD